MREEARSNDARAGVRVNCCDSSVWRGIHHVCLLRCPIEVADRRFKVNLICLPMEGLDVILGIDWLASNHVVIYCGQRSVVFLDAEGLELISSNQA